MRGTTRRGSGSDRRASGWARGRCRSSGHGPRTTSRRSRADGAAVIGRAPRRRIPTQPTFERLPATAIHRRYWLGRVQRAHPAAEERQPCSEEFCSRLRRARWRSGAGAGAQDRRPDQGRGRALPTASGSGSADRKTDAAGIKEALAVGTERAVKILGRENGFFGNAAVKILMPSSLQKVAEVARMAGYQKQVDGVHPEHEPRRRGRGAASPPGTSAMRSAA